jgi:hypothetical protein
MYVVYFKSYFALFSQWKLTNYYVIILIFFFQRAQGKTNFTYIIQKDKCKINPCGWPKSQTAPSRIEVNSKVGGVFQKHNLVNGVKFY